MSFEHYPYDGCDMPWSNLYQEPELTTHIMQVWRNDGLPPDVPLRGHKQGSPWDLWVEKYEEARRLFASFLGAETDEVALVAGASAGMNSVARALWFIFPKLFLVMAAQLARAPLTGQTIS
jgi:hypothetical protein